MLCATAATLLLVCKCLDGVSSVVHVLSGKPNSTHDADEGQEDGKQCAHNAHVHTYVTHTHTHTHMHISKQCTSLFTHHIWIALIEVITKVTKCLCTKLPPPSVVVSFCTSLQQAKQSL